MCTLHAPCSHFINNKILEKYLLRIEEGRVQLIWENPKNRFILTPQLICKKLKMDLGNSKIIKKNDKSQKNILSAIKDREERSLAVLEETYLNDRNIDRNLQMVRTYRQREIEIQNKSSQKQLENGKLENLFLSLENTEILLSSIPPLPPIPVFVNKKNSFLKTIENSKNIEIRKNIEIGVSDGSLYGVENSNDNKYFDNNDNHVVVTIDNYDNIDDSKNNISSSNNNINNYNDIYKDNDNRIDAIKDEISCGDPSEQSHEGSVQGSGKDSDNYDNMTTIELVKKNNENIGHEKFYDSSNNHLVKNSNNENNVIKNDIEKKILKDDTKINRKAKSIEKLKIDSSISYSEENKHDDVTYSSPTSTDTGRTIKSILKKKSLIFDIPSLLPLSGMNENTEIDNERDSVKFNRKVVFDFSQTY